MSSPSFISPPPPPPGLNYIAIIQPSLTFLVIGCICTAMLVPITVILFFFSTPALRRKPIFLLNVTSILLGFTEGVLGISCEMAAILGETVHGALTLTLVFLMFFAPLFAEGTLIVRVLAAYPPSRLSRLWCAAVYVPIVLFKVGRAANIGYAFSKLVTIALHSPEPQLAVGQIAWSLPGTRAEWFLQTFDTAFASALFLFRIWQGTSGSNSPVPSSCVTAKRGSTRSSYVSRLRALFWIAACNFTFPVFLNVAQLSFAFNDSNFIVGGYVYLVNTYTSIVGALLATIWCWSGPEGAAGAHELPAVLKFYGGGSTQGTSEAEKGSAGTGVAEDLSWSVATASFLKHQPSGTALGTLDEKSSVDGGDV